MTAGRALMEAADLKSELLRRSGRDQQVRQRMVGGSPSPDAVEELGRVDAENLAWLKRVVEDVGWPTRTEVGDDGAHAFWLLVQHADADSDFQARCLRALEAAVEAGEADPSLFAYLTDRVRLARGDRQLYGTQCDVREGKFVPRPLEDEAEVDERRKAVGLGSLAEYLEQLAAAFGDASRYAGRPPSGNTSSAGL